MKVGIFDPYLDTLGGGEKYVFDIALCLSRDHAVSLFWDEPAILKKAEERFNFNLSSISITQNIFTSKTSFFEKIKETKEYDVIFYISDGSIPTLFSKKNILIFQFPTLWASARNPITWFKLKKINAIVCYSHFVKNFLDQSFGVESIVIPPVVDIASKILKKENIILTVGRFTRGKNEKKQEVLIDVFKKMCDKGLTKWKFIVLGSVLSKDKKFVEGLKRRAKGYPIQVIENISYEKLIQYYGKARIYWHAAGFGEDLVKHPEKGEHFGITTVEAMGRGAVPVVFNGGGQQEIVVDMESGLLWDKKEELMDRTKLLIRDRKRWEDMSQRARKRASEFGRDNFCELIRILAG